MKYLRRRAREVLSRLFSRLCGTSKHEMPVRIYFADRFSSGDCHIAVLIPTTWHRLRLISLLAWTHQHYRNSPAIMNTSGSCCLRLAYRFPHIKHGETNRIRNYAKTIAMWAMEILQQPVIVIEVPGIVELRHQLDLET